MALLLKPLQAGSLQLVNRLVMPPMASAKGELDGKVTKEIMDYYRGKSAGGYISLIIVEHSYVKAEGKAHNRQISVADDSMIEGLSNLAQVIQNNGSKAILQISHAGSGTKEATIGQIPVAPSVVRNPISKIMPRELTIGEIDDIIAAFSNAARRAKEAGFDGVELHSAHGYLLNQFYSPLTNKRQDEYGGDVHNRIRIHLKVIKAVREVVGEDYPILLRLGAADYIEGGTVIEESQIAASEFEKAGVNILDISGGMSSYTVPGLTGPGYFAPLSETIKKVVTIPVILTGGVTDAQAAEQLLAAGKADLIGVGRAIFKDSLWAEQAIKILS